MNKNIKLINWGLYLARWKDPNQLEDIKTIKERPVLCIQNSIYTIDESVNYSFIKCTTNPRMEEYDKEKKDGRVDKKGHLDYFEYKIKDWEEAGLIKQTVVRLSHRFMSMNNKNIEITRHIGTLTSRDKYELSVKIKENEHRINKHN